MNTLFRTQIASGNLTVYMDNMAVHIKQEEGETEADHVKRHRRIVSEMLKTLGDNDLYLNIDKCEFEQPHIDFLGVRVENNQLKMEEGKVEKVKSWLPPRNLKEVQRFLGFTGYYRYFIKGYLAITKPLLELTRQATLWHWDPPQQDTFEMLKAKMCEKPVLQQPDFTKMFYLQTDTSAYGVGAVLSQEGGTPNSPTQKPKHHPVTYFSATFTPTEQNYDIYEREFLGVVKSLDHWRPYLIWTEKPFIIETDHENLTYWKAPKKLTGWTARWHEKLQDYNFRIVHIARKTNTPADALSCPNGLKHQEPVKEVTLIPQEAFLNLFEAGSDGSVEADIVESQREHWETLEQWAKMLPIHQLDGVMWKDILGDRLVIPPDDQIKRRVLREWHDHIEGGHRGRDKTARQIHRHYFWPQARPWIEQYVKGCAICQQNKNLTHKTCTPLYKITVPQNAPPFTQITMDLITRLPKSRGFDSVLTIVDHGCSRGAIFLPCHATITGPQIAQLYYQHVYPWYGLPSRIISNRDPRFTSHFGRALAKELGVEWNLSTAYHPQTDGLSERAN